VTDSTVCIWRPSEGYDLAIIDVMLPGIDGWQVLQGIRRAGNGHAGFVSQRPRLGG
jgi:DNA-binding response OmpR family regulator